MWKCHIRTLYSKNIQVLNVYFCHFKKCLCKLEIRRYDSNQCRNSTKVYNWIFTSSKIILPQQLMPLCKSSKNIKDIKKKKLRRNLIFTFRIRKQTCSLYSWNGKIIFGLTRFGITRRDLRYVKFQLARCNNIPSN